MAEEGGVDPQRHPCRPTVFKTGLGAARGHLPYWGERRDLNPQYPEPQSGVSANSTTSTIRPEGIISLLQVAAVPGPGTHSTACYPPKSSANPLNPESQ